MEATLLEKSESTPPSAPAGESSQSQGAMAEKTSGTQGYALYGSLTLIPGFGPDGLLKSFSSSNFRWWFTVIFCSWWSMVAAGVPCSLFPHTKLDVVYADLTTRLGMIGNKC
uniref:Uncharacterized protein n=1 Tax=Arundo donax TaxID=35708 RepID=A0A0A9H252_ARUDO